MVGHVVAGSGRHAVRFGLVSALLAGALVLGSAGSVLAAPPQLVRDVNPGGDSSPYDLAPRNGSVYFAAQATNGGKYRLWRSDGTGNGTRLIGTRCSDAQGFFPTRTTVLFECLAPGIGYELWRSDGTVAGTVLVKNINRVGDGEPSGFVRLNGIVYFSASDGPAHGNELWRTDGTTAGTRMVADIVHGATGSGPTELIAVNGLLLFAATSATGDRELWKSNGTPSGTKRVKNINLTGNSNPTQLTRVGKRLFFVADDGTHGRELWTSDGTGTGTHLTLDIDPAGDGGVDEITALGNLALFSAHTDGTGNTPGAVAEQWHTRRHDDGLRPLRSNSRQRAAEPVQ